MPELPEVETIRRDLQRALRGKRIAVVSVRKRKMIKGSAAGFSRYLQGRVIERIDRRGKLLVVKLGGGKRPSDIKALGDKWVLIHLKMTGQLIYHGGGRRVAGGHGELPLAMAQGEPYKHTHVVVTFKGGGRLYFNDLRQFGYMRLVNRRELEGVLAGFGVEPLSREFTRNSLAEVLRGRKTAVKNILLNQKLIAGLGNIYTDEVCWQAGVRPSRRAGGVTAEEVSRIWRAVATVLRQAIKYRGTTFNNYVDARGRRGGFGQRLKVYGREGQMCRRRACRRIGVVIERVKVGGRSVSFCPNCQV